MGESGMSGQFVVEYDVDHKAEGGEIQVVDGYFVHFFSPSDLPYLAKHVYFILDVSGSMSGKEISNVVAVRQEILSFNMIITWLLVQSLSSGYLIINGRTDLLL